jgi:hypothetical protein
MTEEGENKYFTYSVDYDRQGYCDSFGKACRDVDMGYESPLFYFSNEYIPSNLLKTIRKYHNDAFINDSIIKLITQGIILKAFYIIVKRFFYLCHLSFLK